MINGRIVFVANPTDIQSTDRTQDGTFPLIRFSTTSRNANGFLQRNREIFVLAGGGLSVTYGNFGGNQRVTEFSGSRLHMALFWGRMVLKVWGPRSFGKDELWISNGTESRVTLVTDINPAPSSSQLPMDFHALSRRIGRSRDLGYRRHRFWDASFQGYQQRLG